MQTVEFEHHMGTKVVDLVTGYKGIVTARAEYITGCNQYLVTLTELVDGETRGSWFDEQRLELDHKYADEGPLYLQNVDNGAMESAPVK